MPPLLRGDEGARPAPQSLPLVLALALAGGCAASQPAAGPTRPSQAPRPSAVTTAPASPGPEPVSPPAHPAVLPPPGRAPVEPAAQGGRLAWVNPARCLSPCAYDPTPNLVRVDDHGGLDPRGAHRLSEDVASPLHDLLTAAAGAGHTITINSAFRSYDEQAHLYRTMKQPGRAARPGQSEHQIGTAIDLRLPSPEATDWLAAHAGDFGFARSYPPGKHKITGYRPEPWHIRFVGRSLADELRRSSVTLEELFRQRPDLGVSGTCHDCPARSLRKPCGQITAAGTCKGVLLSWCYDGALATVDCSAFGQRCESIGPGGEHDCR